MSDEEMKAEAEQVLIDGGCRAVRVEGAGDKWMVAAGFEPGQFYAAAFSEKSPLTPNDPVYLARQALATLEKNERPRATPEPQNLPDLGEDIVAAEEEMGESQGDGNDTDHDPIQRTSAELGEPSGLAGRFDGGGADAAMDLSGSQPGVRGEPLDADFSEYGDLPAIEGEDLNLPQLTDEEHIQSVASLSSDPGNTGQGGGEGFGGQDRFIGLDDLDRRRSIRIGAVNRYALTIMPLWTSQDHAELVGLRNFAMGVSEKLWPDDTAKAEALMAKEAVLARVRAVETALMEKVRFLNTAERDDVETFDPEADWP